MKFISLTCLVIVALFFGCIQANTKTQPVPKKEINNLKDDKEQIQKLMSKVLNWANSENAIDLLPTITDDQDSVYTGLDLKKHNQNLEVLRQTNLFTKEFIDNYNQIILILDKGLRNGKYGKWLVGDLPDFSFSSDVNPWTSSQDVPYDEPNPYDFITIEKVNKNTGEMIWKWGKLGPNTDPSFKHFSYSFRVKKEDNIWKVSYLQGFDFEEITKTNE